MNTKTYTEDQLEELSYSPEYAEFIMNYGSDNRIICNGDALIVAMEDGYLFTDFLASLQ